MPSDFALPSSTHLANLTAHYAGGHFNKDGTITLNLKLPAEMAEEFVALSRNDGLALNVSVWETKLDEGMAELARVIGMTLESGSGE